MQQCPRDYFSACTYRPICNEGLANIHELKTKQDASFD